MQDNETVERVSSSVAESAESLPPQDNDPPAAKSPAGFSKSDIAFLAYFPALAASFAAILVLMGPPYPTPFEFVIALPLFGLSLLVPFVVAGISLRIVPAIIPEWHFRRPFAGGALAMVLSFVGPLLFYSLLRWVSEVL